LKAAGKSGRPWPVCRVVSPVFCQAQNPRLNKAALWLGHVPQKACLLARPEPQKAWLLAWPRASKSPASGQAPSLKSLASGQAPSLKTPAFWPGPEPQKSWLLGPGRFSGRAQALPGRVTGKPKPRLGPGWVLEAAREEPLPLCRVASPVFGQSRNLKRPGSWG
jgi:hypothetical protein